MNTLISLVYFMLPAYFANMAPVFAARLFPRFSAPVDFGLSWRNKRILGSNKTWRGVLFGMIAAIIIAFAQMLLEQHNIAMLSFVSYAKNWLELGLLLGFGALFGDSLKSFFKRRAGISPGTKFFPLDQIDFSIGALIFASIVYFPGWLESIAIVIISALGHMLLNYLGFLLKLKKDRI